MGGRTAVCAVHGVGPCWVYPRGRALPNACVVCSANSQQGGNKKVLYKMILWTFRPLLLFCCVLLPLPSYLSSSSHPQCGFDSHSGYGGLHAVLPSTHICLLLTKSECGLLVCRRNYSLSHIQLTVAAAFMDKPSLGQPKGLAISCFLSAFLEVRTYELVPEGIQVGPVESQRGWVNLLHWWSEKLRWAWQKVTKSRGRVKGSVHLWRHELLNENTYPAHLWRDRDQFPGCLVWLLW